MKKFLAIVCGSLLAFTATQCELRADDTDFGDEVQNFVDRAKDKIENAVAKLRAYWHSPEVQGKIEEIRAEHRAHLKETLTKLSDRIKKFRTQITPVIEARIQVEFMKLHAKLVDSLRIFKKQAAENYEEELDKFISRLPDELEAKVRAVRASADYQAKKAEVAKRIESTILEHMHEAAFDFRDKLKDFINDRLDNLEERIDNKIASL